MLLVIKNIQIKTIMKYPFTPTRMTKIKYTVQTKPNVDKGMEQLGLSYVAWKSLWQISHEVKHNLSYDPAISPLGI